MPEIFSFLRDDERGSVSLWNLFWLTGFCAIMGMAVDMSAAMNTKARLQTVADSASHAGVMDIFPVASDAIPTAVNYGENNIPQHADVILGSDVVLGRWDSDTRSFDTNSTKPVNAIRVVATRDGSRSNQLFTSFLKVVGFDHWDINALSTAVIGDIDMINYCRQGGLIAGGMMEQTSNNFITGNICVHGEESFKISQNNVITCGVVLSTPSPANFHNGQPPVPSNPPCNTDYGNLSNEDMINQSFIYASVPIVAKLEYENVMAALDAFVAGTELNDPFTTIPPYITSVATMNVNSFNNLSNAGNLAPGTLYDVSCGNANKQLKLTGIVQNIGIYTDCEIDVVKDQSVSTAQGSGGGGSTDPAVLPTDVASCADGLTQVSESYVTMLDTASGNTYRDEVTTDNFAEPCGIEPGASGVLDNVFIFTTANANGNRSHKSVTFPNDMQIGRMDGCTEGGGVRIYAGGSIHTPSGTVSNGAQIVTLGDVHIAAKMDGIGGIHIEAVGDIKYAAQGIVTGCSIIEDDLESDVVVTVRPIALVE